MSKAQDSCLPDGNLGTPQLHQAEAATDRQTRPSALPTAFAGDKI